MTKIYDIELSEDEVMEAEDLGLSDFLEEDDERDEILENTTDLEEKLELIENLD